jgi:2-keto-4-pentenoate hydratase/2-oxohepta-3-ene-1,7-dioic acid hydratase in catechol pathway
MKFTLANIATTSGPSAAIVIGQKVVEIAPVTGRDKDRDMLALMSDWQANMPRLEAIAAKADEPELGIPLAVAKLLAPITNPGAIYCTGANYADHAIEMAARNGKPAPPDPRTLGIRSWHFIKTMHCITGPNAEVPIHPRSQKVDWEAELAVVIGRKAFQVPESKAMDYVLGYTVANDLSARDLGRREQLPDSSSFRQDWTAHKNWDASCPLGPWIVLARDVPDPHNLSIALDVNGHMKQNSNTGKMIFNIQEQIADLSRNFTLWPGDIILTGTPAGVGAGRNEFLNKGDVVRIKIEQIGELVNTIT